MLCHILSFNRKAAFSSSLINSAISLSSCPTSLSLQGQGSSYSFQFCSTIAELCKSAISE